MQNNNNGCTDCPRKCGVIRGTESGGGYCGAGENARIARAALHFGEEPCISGTRGSGTVFFTGCALKCEYCQNKEISKTQQINGKTVTQELLRGYYRNLTDIGAHNINLVTPSHFVNAVSDSLRGYKTGVPVIWNSSGYESADTIKRLEGLINVYMPDFKYALRSPAEKYSNAPDYCEAAMSVIGEMYRQTGKYEIDAEGIIRKGLIIRHLILPGNLRNTFAVIDYISKTFAPGEVLFSLMSQYTPVTDSKFPELNRKITREEYERVTNYLNNSSIEDGFYQDMPGETEEDWIPEWDLL